jgi:hypothetical protein
VQRARQVLSEAVDLLERITADHENQPYESPLLGAIADGTFEITRRPAARGGR